MSRNDERIYFRDLAAVERLLDPHVVRVDGVPFVSPDAPEHLTRTHRQLKAIGYAKGWLR